MDVTVLGSVTQSSFVSPQKMRYGTSVNVPSLQSSSPATPPLKKMSSPVRLLTGLFHFAGEIVKEPFLPLSPKA